MAQRGGRHHGEFSGGYGGGSRIVDAERGAESFDLFDQLCDRQLTLKEIEREYVRRCLGWSAGDQ